MAQAKVKNPKVQKKEFNFDNKYIVASSVIIIAVYFLIFEKFFPNSHGRLGHDFNLSLPQLLDGVFWYKTNGLFEVPWFTPSVGGGLPYFANPQGIYYSIPQFLCFLFNPVTSIKLTVLLFGIFGFYGSYLLLNRIFQVSSITSVLGATLFLFNGFYIHRMIIGHIGFHPFMFFPLFLYLVFHETRIEKKINYKSAIFDICIGAAIIAYMFNSGAWLIVPILLLLVLIVIATHELVFKNFKVGNFLLKAFLIFCFGFILSASKLNASISFLNLFPRDLYLLPGISNFSDLLQLWYSALFGIPDQNFANTVIDHKTFLLAQYEFEYGIGIIPLIVFLIGILFLGYKIFVEKILSKIGFMQIILLCSLFLLLLLPLMFNYYTPSWNSFLKSIPFFKSSSTNIRWFCVYVPVLILFTCILIEKISFLNKYKFPVAVLSIAIVLFYNGARDRKFYDNQPYSPSRLVMTYNQVNSGKFKPQITSINSEVTLDDGSIIEGNEIFTVGASQINPYEPLFGYRLENFPRAPLTIGPVMQEDSGGVLNIKNPSGYVFPKENNCLPGGHFTINQKSEAGKFSSYLPFPFVMSSNQKVANSVTMVALLLLTIYIIFYIFLILKAKK